MLVGSKFKLGTRLEILHLSIWEIIRNYAHIIWLYLSNLINPKTIVFMYNFQPLRDNISLYCGITFITVLAVLISLIIARNKFYFLALPLFITGFLITIPAAVARPEQGFTFEPYWMYFSSIWIFCLFGSLIIKLATKINRTLLILFIAIISLFLFIHSQKQLSYGTSEIRYTVYWLKSSPGNALANQIFGELYFSNDLPVIDEMVDPLLEQINAYIKNDQPALAITLCNKIFKNKLKPEIIKRTAILKAAAYEKDKKPKKNKLMLRQIIDTYKKPDIYIQISSTFDQLKMSDTAINVLDECLLTYPKYKEALLLKGIILGNKEKYSESIEIWKKGLEIDPADQRFITLINAAEKLLNNKH
ncbi:MAG: hypothetical protein HQL25_04965 [Candidatus Omnitrophica bacterium]|nr:hypothetical protein [Candidatus Omnitrophota bacterium]